MTTCSTTRSRARRRISMTDRCSRVLFGTPGHAQEPTLPVPSRTNSLRDRLTQPNLQDRYLRLVPRRLRSATSAAPAALCARWHPRGPYDRGLLQPGDSRGSPLSCDLRPAPMAPGWHKARDALDERTRERTRLQMPGEGSRALRL